MKPLSHLIHPLRDRCSTGEEPERKATWLELFFDLAFVAAVAQVGGPLAASYSVEGLVRYSILFLLVWWAWSGHTNYATRFDTDDLVQRLLTLAQIFIVAVMAANAGDALDSESSAGFAAAYAVLRLLLVAQYARARRVEQTRALTTAYAVGFGIAAICWLASALVPVPLRYALWAAALAVDVGTPVVTSHLTVQAPPDPRHLPERYGLFTIILLGESLVGVMKGIEGHDDWTLPAFGSAVFGLAIAFLVWWWYFDGARAAAERRVRTATEARRLMVWSFAHLPLYLGIGIAGIGMEHLILGADDGHLHAEEAWILGVAFAVMMAALAVIDGTSGKARRDPHRARRMTVHYGIASLPIALALVGTHLPPVALAGGLAGLCLLQCGWSLREANPIEARHDVAASQAAP
jgi:low temperature requirement protein LtrA